MSTITEALGWSGSGFMISVFAVADAETAPSIEFRYRSDAPQRIRTYYLEDDDGTLGALRVYEYDLEFEQLPVDLDPYLAECLRRACSEGARLAWLAFEGSFDFRFLLAEEVADQIYGVCPPGGEPVLALDDTERTGGEWKMKLADFRRSL